MCGIFGHIGKELPLISLIEALQHLEYRGYDSWGVVGLSSSKKIFLKKYSGKIVEKANIDLKKRFKDRFYLSLLHTRWATHGSPTRINAHPHFDCQRKIFLVHNGIVENYKELKESLLKKGHKFLSQTDTEVIAHLIEEFFDRDLARTCLKVVKKLEGSFALGVFSLDEPDTLIAIRKNSPLIIGVGKGINFLASDIPALLKFTKKVIYLDDNEIAVLSRERIKLFNFKRKKLLKKEKEVDIKPQEAEKKGFKYFMFKEILEQPEVLRRLLNIYVKKDKITFPDLNIPLSLLKRLERIYIIGCGTAYHAGLTGKYILERFTDLDVKVEVSSEFRYEDLTFKKNTLLIAISQSGETADTLAAVDKAQRGGVKTLGVCNVLGSSLTRQTPYLIYTFAGPEISVASTKAYTAQVMCLLLFTLYLAKIRNPHFSFTELLKKLKAVPSLQEEVLKRKDEIKDIANEFSKFGCFLFLGRGISYPQALEGALKLKEISYIPAEGYPAGEMKHGPIALIDEYRAVVCILWKDRLYPKMLSNMQEIKARKGKVVGILSKKIEESKEVLRLVDRFVMLPWTEDIFSPLIVAPSLQLFAYFVAKNLGCEIDKPRNLAKSVTVE